MTWSLRSRIQYVQAQPGYTVHKTKACPPSGQVQRESRQRRAGVGNKATFIAGTVPTPVGIGRLLESAVDADGMCHEVALAPCPSLPELVTWRCLAELAAGERPLHRSY